MVEHDRLVAKLGVLKDEPNLIYPIFKRETILGGRVQDQRANGLSRGTQECCVLKSKHPHPKETKGLASAADAQMLCLQNPC